MYYTEVVNSFSSQHPRSEIDEIIRDAYLVEKVEKDMVKRAMGMQVNHHALYVGDAQLAGIRAAGGGSGGGDGILKGGQGEEGGTRPRRSRRSHSSRTSNSSSTR